MMYFFNSLPVRTKMLLGFFVVLFIFGIVSLTAIFYINATNTSIERINYVVAVRMDNLSNIQTNAMEGDFVFAEVLTDFKDTPSDRQRYVNMLDQRADAIEKFKNNIVLGGAFVSTLQAIINHSTDWVNLYRNQMRDALLNGSFEKINTIYGQGLSSSYLELSKQCNSLLKSYRQEVIGSTTVLVQAKTFYYIVAGTIFAIAIGCFIAVFFASEIVKRIRYCIDHANLMAQGDFSQKINVDGRDEFGQLTMAFKEMQNNLNNTISSIIDKTNQVVAHVQDVQNINHTIGDNILMNDRKAETVATAVNELVSSTNSIAASCGDAATSSSQSRQSTEQGVQSIRQAVERVKLQSNRTHEDAKNLEALSEQTQKIGFIVNTIDDIANQTNLLALNAAIEAARAGEVGRGFAVVADEVRALASRTTNSTSEIKAMVQSIQDSAKHSVESMSLSVENIGELAASADLLGNVFDEVIANVDQVNTQVTQISASTEEQNVATSEISKNVQDISDSSHKIASLTEHGLQQLDTMVNNLVAIQNSMRFFKLKSKMNSSFVNAESNVYPAGAAARSFEPSPATTNAAGSGVAAYATAQERNYH